MWLSFSLVPGTESSYSWHCDNIVFSVLNNAVTCTSSGRVPQPNGISQQLALLISDLISFICFHLDCFATVYVIYSFPGKYSLWVLRGSYNNPLRQGLRVLQNVYLPTALRILLGLYCIIPYEFFILLWNHFQVIYILWQMAMNLFNNPLNPAKWIPNSTSLISSHKLSFTVRPYLHRREGRHMGPKTEVSTNRT